AWARESPLRAYDPALSVLVVHLPTVRETWVLSPRLPPCGWQFFGAPPARLYSRVHLAKRADSADTFVVRSKDKAEYEYFEFGVREGDPYMSCPSPVFPEDLKEWQRSPDWPAEWQDG